MRNVGLDICDFYFSTCRPIKKDEEIMKQDLCYGGEVYIRTCRKGRIAIKGCEKERLKCPDYRCGGSLNRQRRKADERANSKDRRGCW